MLMKRSFPKITLAAATLGLAACARAAEIKISPGMTQSEGEVRYDILIDGRPFTSYRADEELFYDKPVFYPVLSAAGNQVNRSIPPIQGEMPDHPHHQSAWFNYGEVNGIDYWNLQRTGRRIKHRSAQVDGPALKLALDWINTEDKVILNERKNVAFGSGDGVRWMDHDITLTATDAPVHFGDSKEGAFAIRVAGRLQEKGGTGRYINAEGLEGADQVWGKTSAWIALRGMIPAEAGGEEEATVAIFSHPSTYNHPPYWHARDYGLFAANPFGRKSYDKSAEERAFTLAPGQSVQLRFRLAVYQGKPEKARYEADYAEFAKD